MTDPRQKTDMADVLTAIARKSYGESAIFVKCCSGSPKFWFYLGRRLVSEHDAASHEEAFRELKMKLETMAMFTELQNAKEKAADAADTKRMVEEFAEIARRAYPNCVPVFNDATRTFTVTRDGETLVTETGVTTFDAYRAVMPKLRDEAEAISTALKSFNALPALMDEVFGADAQLIVHPQQPYVTIESRIGKHTVFASSAAATAPEAVSEAHAWLTAMKAVTPSFSRIDAEVLRVFGPTARFAPNGNAGYVSVREGDKELLGWHDSDFDKSLRRVLKYLLCLPSKTVAASEATAAEARTRGVSDEASIEELKAQFRVEAMRVGGPTTGLKTGNGSHGVYAILTFGEGGATQQIRESRENELALYRDLVERLRAMPTFVAPQPSTIAAFNNAVADDLNKRLMPATPAGMGALTFGATASAYAGWGVRDEVTLSNGTAPLNLTVTNTTPEPKAPPTMQPPAPTPIMDTVKADAEAAAWMLAGSQFVKITKEPIVALLSRHLGPGDDSLRARIAAFLDTELGTAIVAAILSGGLSAMPAPPGSPAANINARLARELRVKSMATVGDAAVDLIAGPMRHVISLYIAGAPEFPMGLPDGADRIVVPATVAAEVAR